jgi:hypothetical protein
MQTPTDRQQLIAEIRAAKKELTQRARNKRRTYPPCPKSALEREPTPMLQALWRIHQDDLASRLFRA